MPNFMDVPYPSDVYLQNGRIAKLPGIDLIVHAGSDFLTNELSKLDGFSRFTLSHYYIDDFDAMPNDDGTPQAAAIDPSTLPATEAACVADASSTFLIDLSATDPMKARIPCRASLAGWSQSKTRPLLAIGPARGIVLQQGHQYATVLTSRVKTMAGKPIAASADFAKLVKGDASVAVSGVYGKPLQTIETLLGAALGNDTTIVGIAPYTTHTMESELLGLRDALESAPPATLDWNSNAPMGSVKFSKTGGMGFTATLDDFFGVVDPKDKLPDGTDDPDVSLPVRAHDRIDAIGTATFQGINYLQSKPGGYTTIDHATFAKDGSGKIIPQAPNKIWISFAIPTAPMPTDGYPVVIVQHGLSSSRLYMWTLANTFCAKGWAVAAIDSVTFGARAPDPSLQTDLKSDQESAPGAKYKGPDGFADTLNGSDNLFGGLKNIGALRDQFRQAEFDTAQVVHLLRSNPVLAELQTGATPPKIDGSKIAYAGDSLGGIQGAVAAAIEPHVSAWILNVAGGGVVQEVAARAPGIYSLLALAGAFNFGFYNDQLVEGHIMVDIVQTIAELGDPLLYASHMVMSPPALMGQPTKPRNIMQIEVVFDELVTNEGDEALARAAGYPLAKPNIGSNSELFDFGKPPRGIPLLEAGPDAMGAIHDVPMPGVTAVVVQDSPSGHGSDFVRSKAKREWKAPYALFGTNAPFTHFDPADFYEVRTGYRELQKAATSFIADAFAGKVPSIFVLRPPVRDLDDDGNLDATDPNPNDPRIK